jgi:spermidine synthase
MGVLNAGIAMWGSFLLAPQLAKKTLGIRIRAALVIAGMLVALVFADQFTTYAEEQMYADPVVYTKQSQYQRLLVTKSRSGFNLFLNGNLQFASADEYRYHEALVHPAMSSLAAPRRVLILGGGDGLALREALKYTSVEQVTLVDLDPKMTALSEAFPPLGALNGNAFRDPRVRVVNEDAMIWIERERDRFDVAIIDFPDPSSFSLGKLYTTRFYRMLRERLTPDALVSVQCTSPLYAPRAYWCIIRTMEAAGLHVRPYQATVPSFGVWGFALARQRPFDAPMHIRVAARFLDGPTLAAMFIFPRDMAAVPVEINRLDNQMLVRYYEEEWGKWS